MSCAISLGLHLSPSCILARLIPFEMFLECLQCGLWRFYHPISLHHMRLHTLLQRSGIRFTLDRNLRLQRNALFWNQPCVVVAINFCDMLSYCLVGIKFRDVFRWWGNASRFVCFVTRPVCLCASATLPAQEYIDAGKVVRRSSSVLHGDPLKFDETSWFYHGLVMLAGKSDKLSLIFVLFASQFDCSQWTSLPLAHLLYWRFNWWFFPGELAFC